MFGTCSGREEEYTFEVVVMADDAQNYSMFSSRLLVDTVGDVTDEALKASRLKDVIGVLAGRLFNWGQRKSLFPLHLGIKCCALEMAAAGATDADLSSASMLAYAGGLVLEQALRDVGECLNADALADAILALEDFSTGGIMAPINFDPATGLGNQGAIIQQVVNGAWVTVDEG